MNTMKIFLGSNIKNLEAERDTVFSFVNELNKKLMPNHRIRIIELDNPLNSIKDISNDSTIENHLNDCESAFFIINQTLNINIRYEFEYLRKCFLDNDSPRIIVLFRNFKNIDALNPEAKDFEQYLREELDYYYDIYQEVEHLKFRLMFELVINSPSLEITCQREGFYIDNVLVSSSESSPYYNNHQQLKLLKEKQNILLDKLQDSDDPNIEIEFEQVTNQIQDMEEEFVNTFQMFYEASGTQKISPLMKRAMIYIKNGDIAKANEILKNETLKDNVEKAASKYRVNKKNEEDTFKKYLNDLPTTASIRLQMGEQSYLDEAKDLYEAAIQYEYEFDMDPEIHFDYIEFLARYDNFERIEYIALQAKSLLRKKSKLYHHFLIAMNTYLIGYYYSIDDMDNYHQLIDETKQVIEDAKNNNIYYSVRLEYEFLNLTLVNRFLIGEYQKALNDYGDLSEYFISIHNHNDSDMAMIQAKIKVILMISHYMLDNFEKAMEYKAIILNYLNEMDDSIEKDYIEFSVQYLNCLISMEEESLEESEISFKKLSRLYLTLRKSYSGKPYYEISAKYQLIDLIKNFYEKEDYKQLFNDFNNARTLLESKLEEYPLEMFSLLNMFYDTIIEINKEIEFPQLLIKLVLKRNELIENFSYIDSDTKKLKMASHLFDLASHLFKLKEYTKAKIYFEESVPYYRQLDNKAYLSTIYFNLAYIHLILHDDIKSSISYYEQSLNEVYNNQIDIKVSLDRSFKYFNAMMTYLKKHKDDLLDTDYLDIIFKSTLNFFDKIIEENKQSFIDDYIKLYHEMFLTVNVFPDIRLKQQYMVKYYLQLKNLVNIKNSFNLRLGYIYYLLAFNVKFPNAKDRLFYISRAITIISKDKRESNHVFINQLFAEMFKVFFKLKLYSNVKNSYQQINTYYQKNKLLDKKDINALNISIIEFTVASVFEIEKDYDKALYHMSKAYKHIKEDPGIKNKQIYLNRYKSKVISYLKLLNRLKEVSKYL